MKAILSICLILLYNNAFTTSQLFTRFLKHNPPPPNVTEFRPSDTFTGFFTQKLDHFDSSNTKTWSQKFFVNTEFFNNNTDNAAFLMLGGEDEAFEKWMTYGWWVTNAKKYGAILFQLEHRYYGESQPFSDFATENLRFLSSQQAVADAAEFIKAMNVQYSLGSNVKWISFGGSYSGSLSAWLRLKYPELVYAAVSSSAPLQAQLGNLGYYQVVVEDLENTNEQCVASLKIALAEIDVMLRDPDLYNDTITSMFNLCEPIEQYHLDDVNVISFYSILANIFATVAQYNGRVDITLEDLCETLNDESKGSVVRRLASIINGEDACVDFSYKTAVDSLKDTTINGNMARQWYYQVCTEFAWFPIVTREDKVFGRGATIDYYTKMCNEGYGLDFNSTFIQNQVDKTNAYYHGTDINATRIVFTHGSVDPWHSAGILKANNPDSPVIFIKGTAHCEDLYEPSEGDLPQLTRAREDISKLILVWLKYV